jgi:hypothetical protein
MRLEFSTLALSATLLLSPACQAETRMNAPEIEEPSQTLLTSTDKTAAASEPELKAAVMTTEATVPSGEAETTDSVLAGEQVFEIGLGGEVMIAVGTGGDTPADTPHVAEPELQLNMPALDPEHFVDNASDIMALIAADLASLGAETTGSVAAALSEPNDVELRVPDVDLSPESKAPAEVLATDIPSP